MTAQISDTVIYHECAFALVGFSDDGLFDPEDIGLNVASRSTACWRGYYCTYTIDDDLLLLTRLTPGLDEVAWRFAEEGLGPIVFGRLPRRDTLECFSIDLETGAVQPADTWTEWYYADLEQPIPYSGGLLIGAEFIAEMFIHMGHHPAYNYRVVHELLFEQGRLAGATDRSAQLEAFRIANDDGDAANTRVRLTDNFVARSREIFDRRYRTPR